MTTFAFIVIFLIGAFISLVLSVRQANLARVKERREEQIVAAGYFDEARAWERVLVTQDQVAERFNVSRELLREFEPERMPCPKTDAPHAWSGPIVVVEPTEVTSIGPITKIRTDPGWAIKECVDCGMQDEVPMPKPRENLLTRGQGAHPNGHPAPCVCIVCLDEGWCWS